MGGVQKFMDSPMGKLAKSQLGGGGGGGEGGGAPHAMPAPAQFAPLQHTQIQLPSFGGAQKSDVYQTLQQLIGQRRQRQALMSIGGRFGGQ